MEHQKLINIPESDKKMKNKMGDLFVYFTKYFLKLNKFIFLIKIVNTELYK